MSKAIKVENISKAYQLGDFGTGTLSRDLERFFAKIRGKEDPFLKIGETNDRTVKSKSDIVWSLRDLNFEIEQGDAVGVIGRNGAGKSTLLKILSRVTSPTTGSVKVKGRIASLLEVGTGFHPELTGRENIFLNGAILGMRKAEIKRKFDEIVAFAGVERYIDTPVKRYSSGMYVRLAFAVAAHLESEILIVDEVLAVGDAEFQKKCLGKMGDISKGEGRTILFVSHNMGSIYKLCNKGILLKNGVIEKMGSSGEVIDYYSNTETNELFYKSDAKKISYKKMFFEEVKLTDLDGALKADYNFEDNLFVEMSINILEKIPNAKLSFTIQSKTGEYLTTIVENLADIIDYKTGITTLQLKLNSKVIAPNSYFIRVALFLMNADTFDLIEMICPFRIFDTGTKLAELEGVDYGNYFLDYKFSCN